MFRITSPESASAAFMVDGTEWHLQCRLDGGALTIDGDNEIANMAREYLANGGEVQPYVALPTFQTADAAKLAMIAWIDGVTAKITGPVPADERLSWTEKETAARAIVASTADQRQTDLIGAEAAITGETVSDLAAKIIAKADVYRAVVARIAGLRRATAAALDAESDPANYETILAAAQSQAVAMAAQLGITL